MAHKTQLLRETETNKDLPKLPIPQKLELDMRRVDEICVYKDLLKLGKLSIIDEISQETFRDLRENLIWCASSGVEKIEVEISSPGGDVFSGFAIYDMIRKTAREFKVEIRTVGSGYMASMASIVFQAGTKRLVTSNAMYMIHEVSTLKWGDEQTSKIEDEFKLLKRLQGKMIDILCERSSLTKEMVEQKWERKDWWLDADEMLELGLCDQILDTRCKEFARKADVKTLQINKQTRTEMTAIV